MFFNNHVDTRHSVGLVLTGCPKSAGQNEQHLGRAEKNMKLVSLLYPTPPTPIPTPPPPAYTYRSLQLSQTEERVTSARNRTRIRIYYSAQFRCRSLGHELYAGPLYCAKIIVRNHAFRKNKLL